MFSLHATKKLLDRVKALMDRFPGALGQSLEAHGVPEDFIEMETAEMSDGRYTKTENRSLVGIMNEFR